MERADVSYAFRVFRVGAHVSLLVAVASAVYLAATPDGEHRTALLILAAVTFGSGVAALRLPVADIVSSGRAGWVLGGWNAAGVVLIAASAVLDGPDSPYVGLFFFSVAFASVTLPRRFVVALTALNVVALASVGVVNGVEGTNAWWAMVLRCAALAATALVCSPLVADRTRQLLGLQHSSREVVRRLALVVEHRDHDTGGHVERIGAYSALIADELGFDAIDRERLRLASILHDVGKVGIPDTILLKPGPLTPDERTLMETHTEIGHHMLAGSGLDVLDAAAEIALTHHERYDGTGYPRGVAGPAIPLAGRIVAVVDVFDALTSDRVYKSAMDFDAALDIVRDGAGTQFDPEIVAAFCRRLPEARAVHTQMREPAAPLAAVAA